MLTMHQALLEALFTHCVVFELYTLRGSTCYPLSQIKAQRSPHPFLRSRPGRARAQTPGGVWLEISHSPPRGSRKPSKGMWELPLPTTDAQISSWCVRTELRSSESSRLLVQLSRSGVPSGVTRSQCMGPIPRLRPAGPEARRRLPDVTPSSQPSGSLPCDPAPPHPLPSSPSCPSDPFSTLLPRRSSRIQNSGRNPFLPA